MEPEVEIFGALVTGDTGTFRRLLGEHPDLANARNENGDSLLMTAAYMGRRDLFDLLIETGAGVSLFEASALGLVERVVERLSDEPALVNAYSHDGWTALHLASFFGHGDVANLLLARGADVNARAAGDHTALHEAALRGNLELAQLLLAHGADATIRNHDGHTPLDVAQAKGHAALARRLRGELP